MSKHENQKFFQKKPVRNIISDRSFTLKYVIHTSFIFYSIIPHLQRPLRHVPTVPS